MEILLVNIIVLAILIGAAGGIVWYLYRAKKRGQNCVGCPYAKLCGGKCSGRSAKTKGSGRDIKN